MKALFITLEGIEGSGKTLQMQLLEQEFRRRRIPCFLTREPGGTAFGRELRKILLRQDEVRREPLAELLLYLADRYQHLKELVEPNLALGRHVISDRYHDATLAYQGYARGIGFETVDRLANILGLRRPDLTLVLDLDVTLGLDRARRRDARESRQEWGRFESEEMNFHQRVREGYDLLAQREPDRICIVDAAGSREQVFERIVPYLERKGAFQK